MTTDRGGEEGAGRSGRSAAIPAADDALEVAAPPSGGFSESCRAPDAFLTHADRNRAIYEARISGATRKEIAARFGITAVRVKQILRQYNATRGLDPPVVAPSDAPALARRLRGVVHSDVEPLAIVRSVLVVARRAGYEFDAALNLAAEAALSYLPERDACGWWSTIDATRDAWHDAYERAPSPLAGLPRGVGSREPRRPAPAPEGAAVLA